MFVHYTTYEDGYRYCILSEPVADIYSEWDLESLAEKAAADFHSERDGWEGQWPRTITLYAGKDGPELGRFTVEREYEPSFSAQRATPEPQNKEST